MKLIVSLLLNFTLSGKVILTLRAGRSAFVAAAPPGSPNPLIPYVPRLEPKCVTSQTTIHTRNAAF